MVILLLLEVQARLPQAGAQLPLVASFAGKGPSIKDVSPKGEGGGYKKCPKRRRLLVDLRRQGEGGYPKNLKFGEMSFMDGP